jgi:hypothetical protein
LGSNLIRKCSPLPMSWSSDVAIGQSVDRRGWVSD